MVLRGNRTLLLFAPGLSCPDTDRVGDGLAEAVVPRRLSESLRALVGDIAHEIQPSTGRSAVRFPENGVDPLGVQKAPLSSIIPWAAMKSST